MSKTCTRAANWNGFCDLARASPPRQSWSIALNNGTAIRAEGRRIGPALVFERLREETGCRIVIEQLAGERKHGFALERTVFLTVLHRLFAGGSDRAADRWREDYRIDGVEGLELKHLYRATLRAAQRPASIQLTPYGHIACNAHYNNNVADNLCIDRAGSCQPY